MWATLDVARATPTSARRRRERRIRSFFRHGQMAVVTAQHHSAQRCCTIATQTVGSPSATYAATAASPMVEYVDPAPVAPAPVIEYVAPAPSVTYAAPALVFEYVAPAPVFEFIAPASAGSFVAPSQQLRPAYTAATVTTGVNLDAAVEGSASQVVGSLPHGEVFAAPVFNQVHQEQLTGGEIPENLVEIPVVQKQVIVQASPHVVGSLPPVAGFTSPMYNPVHQEQFSAGDTAENFAVFPVVQEQVLVGMRPAPLSEVAGPQSAAATGGYVAAGVLLLGAPSLADSLAEAIDGSTLSFLLQHALEVKRKEEEEAVETAELEKLEKKVAAAESKLLVELQRDREEGVHVTSQTWDSLSRVEQLAVWWYLAKDEVRKRKDKRRKKKRKKKKLPKVSSHSSCGRARCRQRQYAGHFFPCVSLRHGGRCPCCAGRACTQVQFLSVFCARVVIPQAQFLDWVVVFTTSSTSLSWRRGFSLWTFCFADHRASPVAFY